MLRASIGFFVLGLIAFIAGLNQIAGLSFEIGRLFLFVFLALAIVSFVSALLVGRRIGPRI